MSRETRTRAELAAQHGGTLRKPYSGCAGYDTSRVNPLTGGFLVVYRAKDQGIADPKEEGGAWLVVCETHGTCLNIDSLRAARSVIYSGGTEFCDECRELAAADPTAVQSPLDARRQRELTSGTRALLKAIETASTSRLGSLQPAIAENRAVRLTASVVRVARVLLEAKLWHPAYNTDGTGPGFASPALAESAAHALGASVGIDRATVQVREVGL
jgi:hypothetical protein